MYKPTIKDVIDCSTPSAWAEYKLSTSLEYITLVDNNRQIVKQVKRPKQQYCGDFELYSFGTSNAA